MKLIESLKKNVLTDFNGFYYVNKDNLSICKWVRFDRNDLQTYPCSINLKDKNNIKANWKCHKKHVNNYQANFSKQNIKKVHRKIKLSEIRILKSLMSF